MKNIFNMFSVNRGTSFLLVLCALIFPQSSESKGVGDQNIAPAEQKQLCEKEYSSSRSSSAAFVFADNNESDEDLDENDLKDFKEYQQGIEKHENVMGGNFESLKKAEGYGTMLDGREDDFASLAILDSVQKSLDEAKTFHNMKQMLPDFRKTFQDLKDARDYHDKTVEYLQEAGECIIRYLSPHYSDAARVWFGEDCDFFGQGTIYCHYKPEKEIGDMQESKGLYDDVCPNDSEHLCFIQKIEDKEYQSGVSGLLIGYYNQGKEDDALQETQTYLNEDDEEPETEVEEVGENEYTAQIDVKSDVDDDSVDKDVYVSERDDTSLMDRDDANASEIVPSAEQTDENMKADVDEEETDEKVKDPAKAEALAEETRKEHLMNWVWGSQVASDISRDLDSKSPKFGNRVKKFPLWNDQKEFYDQYIDGKYENIKEYVLKAPMPNALLSAAQAINDIFEYEPIIIEDELGGEKLKIEADEIRTAIGDVLAAFDMSEFEKEDSSKDAIDGLIEEENKDLENLKIEHEKKIEQLKLKKERLQQQLAEANSDLSNTNEEVNKDSKVIASSVNTDRATKENEESDKEMEGLYKTPVDVKQSPMNKKFAKEKEDSDTAKSEAQAERKKKISDAEFKEKRVKLLTEELKKVKEQVEDERREFVKKYAEHEEELRSGFATKVAELDVPTLLDSTVISAIEDVIDKASKTLSEKHGEEILLPVTAATLSGEMIACLREEASKIAEETKTTMDSMKESGSLYYISTADEVQGVHSDMIDRMKSISTCEKGGVKSAPVAEKVFGDMCDDVSCLTPDESKDKNGLTNYFVGAMALKEDLKTPTPPVAFSSAPLREIFHLDLTDYDNIDKHYKDEDDLDKNADITITADGFLDSDLEIPLIWRYVLRRHTYGQKQFNLLRLLGNKDFGDDVRGDPDQTYIRSGSFPCYIGSNVVDVGTSFKLRMNGMKLELVVDKLGYSINKTKDAGIYGKVPCKGFSIERNKVIDYAVDASPTNGPVEPTLKGLVSETSELGTVLAYIPNGTVGSSDPFHPIDPFHPEGGDQVVKHKLTFNASMQKAIGIISKSEDMDEDKEKEALFYLANRTLFERNQFGDFLNQVEQEANAHEGLIKVENQVDEIIKNLQEIFYGTGLIIPDDFDLLNEEDYKKAADTLDEQKEVYMNKAQKEIQDVKGSTVSIAERTKALLHTITVLAADSDEIVQLNGDEDIDELSAKILNKQADNSVADEYDEEGRKAQERRIRQLQPPYCEVHPYK